MACSTMHEIFRKLRVRLAQPYAFAAFMRKGDLGERVAADVIASRHEVVEQYPQRVDVGRDSRWASVQHFWSQIQWGSSEAAHRLRGTVIDKPPARAKVHQRRTAIFLAHHVMCLDITVQNARLMNGFDCPTQITADERRFSRGQRSVRFQELAKCATLDEFHPYADVVVCAIEGVDGHDIRVPNAGEQLRLAQHALRTLRACGPGSRDQFERHIERQLAVVSAVDGTERPFPNLVEDQKVPPARRGYGVTSGCPALGGAVKSRWRLR